MEQRRRYLGYPKKTISYDNQALLVGKEGSTIISSCMLIYHPFQTFIYRFSIDPKNHRQGIGSQMCSFIEKTLKDKGMLHPTLFTEIENKDANDFWSAMGRENLYQVNCFVKNLDS